MGGVRAGRPDSEPADRLRRRGAGGGDRGYDETGGAGREGGPRARGRLRCGDATGRGAGTGTAPERTQATGGSGAAGATERRAALESINRSCPGAGPAWGVPSSADGVAIRSPAGWWCAPSWRWWWVRPWPWSSTWWWVEESTPMPNDCNARRRSRHQSEARPAAAPGCNGPREGRPGPPLRLRRRSLLRPLIDFTIGEGYPMPNRSGKPLRQVGESTPLRGKLSAMWWSDRPGDRRGSRCRAGASGSSR
jgi:hypothetical protein